MQHKLPEADVGEAVHALERRASRRSNHQTVLIRCRKFHFVTALITVLRIQANCIEFTLTNFLRNIGFRGATSSKYIVRARTIVLVFSDTQYLLEGGEPISDGAINALIEY